MFDYSTYVIITIKRGNELTKLAIVAAKSSNDKKWIKSNRIEGALYKEMASTDFKALPRARRRRRS